MLVRPAAAVQAHTSHHTLHISHYTLHTTHYTVRTTHYTLHTTHHLCTMGVRPAAAKARMSDREAARLGRAPACGSEPY